MAASQSISSPSHTPLPKVDAVEVLVDKANTDHPRLVLSSEGAGSKQVDGPQFVSTINDADSEPIVTRKELWSYYRMLSSTFDIEQTFTNRTFVKSLL